MSTIHLRKRLSSETNRILRLTQEWQIILQNNADMSEDIAGKIRAIIGLSNLLVNDKFQQFSRLLETYESKSSDKELKITMSDLEGFWDLVYIQIEDVIKKYNILKLVQENNWEELANEHDVGQTKRLPLSSIGNGTPKTNRTPKSNSALKVNGSRSSSPRLDYTIGSRQRLAEAKLKVQQLNNTASPTFISRSSTSSSAQENIPTKQDPELTE